MTMEREGEKKARIKKNKEGSCERNPRLIMKVRKRERKRMGKIMMMGLRRRSKKVKTRE